MNINVILFRTMGDVLMGTTIVHAIKDKYPAATITFYTEPAYTQILDGNPEIDKIVALPNATYPMVYDHILAKKTKDEVIVKLGMANQYDTCWHHNQETASMHMIDWYASRTGLDIIVKDKVIRLYLTDKDRADFAYKALLTKRYVVMHTTSLLETKNWPIGYFNHLAQMIKEKYNIEIIQIGGPTDASITDATNLLGKTDIKATKQIIDAALFYVGIDSGSSYIAGAANIPTFLIMGSTQGMAQDPNQPGPLVGPIGDNVHYIEANRPNDIHCRPIPCISHCALNSPCINTISPEQVFKVISENIKD